MFITDESGAIAFACRRQGMSQHQVGDSSTWKLISSSDRFSSTRFLGSRAVAVLNNWFQTNRDYPYPDDERTERLAREAGRREQTPTTVVHPPTH